MHINIIRAFQFAKKQKIFKTVWKGNYPTVLFFFTTRRKSMT